MKRRKGKRLTRGRNESERNGLKMEKNIRENIRERSGSERGQDRMEREIPK